MAKRQFGILYHEFLFRLVDREVLTPREGDISKLLGRFAAVLVLLSLPFVILVCSIGGNHMPRETLLLSALASEHSLVATTMLIVGLLSVLSWDAAFPDRRDVLVLAPLPVRLRTMFLAKAASLAAALSVAVVIFNAGPGLALPLALSAQSTSLLDMIWMPQFYRAVVAYWLTMFAAGTFVLCCVLCVQGAAAQLPRQILLRFSAILQMAVFCLFVGVYFLEPPLASPAALAAAENHQLLTWLPSYWFLGLFQQLNGFPTGPSRSTLIALAHDAWAGVAVSVVGAGTAYLLAYGRTLRKILEQPDIIPGFRRLGWFPSFRNSLETAITHFSIRCLLRSRQHRVLFSFYLGIGFAIIIPFLKTPVAKQLSTSTADDPWHQVSLPLLASSFVLMCFWILGARVVFAIPVELRANWIFRITQVRRPADYCLATRRAIYVLALTPVWATSAVFFFSIWPWRPAAGHLAILVCFGIVLAELWLRGLRKIPFTCSYLPGRSNLHITFMLCLTLGLNLTYWSAEFERLALSDVRKYTWLIVGLTLAAIIARWLASKTLTETRELVFEEEPEPVVASLGLHRDGILPAEPVAPMR